MRSALRITGKDLKLRVRDRSAFIVGIVAPLSLAFIFNLILADALLGTGPELHYGLVDQDQSEVSTSFGAVLEDLESQEIITLTRFENETAANSGLDEGRVGAYFLIRSGFGTAVVEGGSPTIGVVGDPDSPNTTHIAASIAGQFGSGVQTARLAVLTTAELIGVPPTPEFVEQLTTDPATAAFTFEISDIAAATRQLDGTTYFAAGMAIFFMFFTVQYGVIGLLEERREGTLARLYAAPIPRAAVLVGKAVLALVLGVVSMTVLMVASSLLMGADWGPILGAGLLVVTAVLAGVGLMGIAGAFARTPEGASNIGSIIAVVLGLLGGVFFPLGQGDDLLSKASLLTPHAWFLRGLGDISGGAPWTDALPAAAVLLGFAIVSGTVAAVLFRRRMEQ